MADAVRTEHEITLRLVSHQNQPDAWMPTKSIDQSRMSVFDLLPGGAARQIGERHQPEVARGEHDDLFLLDSDGALGLGADDVVAEALAMGWGDPGHEDQRGGQRAHPA